MHIFSEQTFIDMYADSFDISHFNEDTMQSSATHSVNNNNNNNT